MKIKSITIKNIGPFFGEHCLQLDSDITVITGANDVGKSIFLECFERFTSKSTIEETMVNYQFLTTTDENWKTSKNIWIKLKIQVNPQTTIRASSTIKYPEYQDVDISYFPAPDVNIYNLHHGKARYTFDDIKRAQVPINSIQINPTKIRSGAFLSTSQNQGVTKLMLDYAFNGNVNEILPPITAKNVLRRRYENANKRMRSLFEQSPLLQQKTLRIVNEGPQSTNMSIEVVEKSGQSMPLGVKSTGYSRFLSYSVQIAIGADFNNDYCNLILIDEPGLYLHADSQRQLRNQLADLTKNANIQVVYITHSPSMISGATIDSIRLIVQRQQFDEQCTNSHIEKKPYDQNFQKVRTTLGLSPEDSLLYSPICLLVEGETELLAMELIFEKMVHFHPDTLSGFEQVLRSIHILDSRGSQFSIMCKLVESQGEYPIMFFDGDNLNGVLGNLRTVKPAYLEIDNFEYYHLPKPMEIEQIIKEEIYFRAFGEIYRIDNAHSKFIDYINSLDKDSNIHKRAFTKKIDAWVVNTELGDTISYVKPTVMKLAVELCDDVNDFVEVESILALMNRLIELVDKQVSTTTR